jgi:hypothetical protein
MLRAPAPAVAGEVMAGQVVSYELRANTVGVSIA